jgi:nucleotide-binding universal stress UspA family protein
MTILACIDRSEYAASVCDYAAWASQRLENAAVELFHVIERHAQPAATRDMSGGLGVDTSESLLRQLSAIDEERNRLSLQSGRLLLENAANRIKAAGVERISQHLFHGELVDHLKDEEAGASLVVMGKRGEAAHQAKGHLGSNLERAIRASYRPVLITPPTFTPVRSFLLAHDGSKSSGRAIGFLVESGMLNGMEGHLLFVGEGTEAERVRLNDAATRLESAGLSVRKHIRSGRPAQMITDTMVREGVDLLVMGAYGHSPIRNLIIGSTTTEVIQTCAGPMLVCR